MKGLFKVKLVALVRRMFSYIVPTIVNVHPTFIPRCIGDFTQYKNQLIGRIKDQSNTTELKRKPSVRGKASTRIDAACGK